MASALRYPLSWVEALGAWNVAVPAGLAAWLEAPAQCNEAAGEPTTYRGKDTSNFDGANEPA
nr:hypothetical protein [Rhizobium lusitanum]